MRERATTPQKNPQRPDLWEVHNRSVSSATTSNAFCMRGPGPQIGAYVPCVAAVVHTIFPATLSPGHQRHD